MYGPRQDNGQEINKDGAVKVKATVNRGQAGRLMVTFHNYTIDSKGKGKEVLVAENVEQQGKECDEAVDMFDQMSLDKE